MVDNNYISSREIKSLLVRNGLSYEIVGCTSYKAMLDIAQKINPDLVIINFDPVENDLPAYIKELRHRNPDIYILALVDPIYNGNLNKVVAAGIDNYVTKPIHREDIFLKIKMGLSHLGSLQGIEDRKEAADFEKQETIKEASKEEQLDGKNKFKDLADLFDRQLEEEDKNNTIINSTGNIPADDLLNEVYVANNHAVTEDLSEHEEVNNTAGIYQTELEPLPETDTENEETIVAPDLTWLDTVEVPNEDELSAEQKGAIETAISDSNDDTFSLTPEPEEDLVKSASGNNKENEGLQLIDEAFSLVEELEEEPPVLITAGSSEKADSPADLEYFDDLFVEEPLNVDISETEELKKTLV
jgi:DNA-binding NarL/FixJ family response regulator